MRTLFRIWLTVSAMALAAPADALAQTATRFNGSYMVSPATGPGRCAQMETPSPLTITNGKVQSADGHFTGSVDSNGLLVLRTKENMRFEGQIDAAGTAKAMGASKQGCFYALSWKKQ